MKKLPTKAHLEFTGFLELVTDVIFHLKETNSNDELSQHKHSRSVVVSCALALESCSNCLLDALDLSARSSSEMERLPTITKIDMYLRLRTANQKFIERGDDRVSKVTELLNIRNSFVHPKRQRLDAEWGVDPDSPDGYKLEFNYSTDYHKQLSIPKTGLHWNPSHAQSAAEATFIFFDFLFRDLLSLDVGEVYHIVGNRMIAELSGNDNHLVASGPVDEYNELLQWATENGLQTRFLKEAEQ